ncbi:exonuclease domain-containing protein [Henriciella sp. AS95]|uniref:exonuclease domain-containing protein n=1 Tax=Henriciella sp. AS95 TaxID=3135782 RepID=UPI003170D7E9
MGFVFYDFETTGVSVAFDQPLQFAAVLTDERLNEVERVELRCRLAPHVIPSPYALIVTGICPEQLVDPDLPELFEFTQAIMDCLTRWSPATWVGYNSIRFDEEVLRQAFYQNLQPKIYATQMNGNKRLDILTAVYAVWCRNRSLLNWPIDDKGRPVFKLDRLAPENGFDSHDAHDALGDVEATLHLARKIAFGDPELWSSLLENRDKKRVLDKLSNFQPFELVSRFGGGPPEPYIGCFCGVSPSNPSVAAFLDLEKADPSELIEASDTTILRAINGSPKVIRRLSINKNPAVFSLEYPIPKYLNKANIVAANPDFRARVARLLDEEKLVDASAGQKPVEKQIYGGFYSKSDQDLLTEFQRADWARRQEIVGKLSDPRLRQLGRRLIAFYQNNLLTESETQQFRTFVLERWNSPASQSVEWTTAESASRAIHDLRSRSDADHELLNSIETFIAGRISQMQLEVPKSAPLA